MGLRERATSWRRYVTMPLLGLAGVFVALGALMMLIKGVLLVVSGNDRSLVPWFGLFSSIGLTLAAVALSRSVTRLRQVSVAATCFGVIGTSASIVAILFLVTGTIPETLDAPAAVGGSYVVLTIGVVICLVLVGSVISTNHSLPGRWRWLPLGIVVGQFPIFIVAGAIGDTIGSEDTTDGLGLALTGVLWMVLGYSLTLNSSSRQGISETDVPFEKGARDRHAEQAGQPARDPANLSVRNEISFETTQRPLAPGIFHYGEWIPMWVFRLQRQGIAGGSDGFTGV